MNDKKDLENLKQHSHDLHAQGYNCAQSVLMCFASELGLDEATAASMMMGMGGGIGGSGEICGVATAMAAAASRILEKRNGEKPEKAKVYAFVRELLADFKSRNSGHIRCCDLKTPGAAKSCSELISEGVEILYNQLYH